MYLFGNISVTVLLATCCRPLGVVTDFHIRNCFVNLSFGACSPNKF